MADVDDISAKRYENRFSFSGQRGESEFRLRCHRELFE